MRYFFSGVVAVLLAVTTPLQAQETLNNQKIDGYRGIWFELGQKSEYGDKYSGGLGTYTAKHIPLAIYAPKAKKTFFVYGGTTQKDQRYLLCMIGEYDHRTKTVSKPTVVYDKLGVNDPHDNPSIALDDAGYIWVFVSGRARGRPGFKYRSKKPYSIEAFDQITKEEMTYPQPKYIPGKGFLNLFTKYTGVRELYFETSPDGVNWSDDQKLVGMKRAGDKNSGHYQISGQYGDKVVFFCNWHPNGNVDQRTNMYYLQTTDFGKTWTTIDGQPLELPVADVDSRALVKEYFSEGKNVYIKDVGFDSKGNPIALYLTSGGHKPGPAAGTREWYVMHWNGKAWENHRVASSDHNYDMGSLFIKGRKWTVIAPLENSPQPWGGGGEIVTYESNDNGKTWSRGKQITRYSARNNNYIRRVANGHDPFMYFWADGNPDAFSQSELYFGDRKGNVWKLPYDMQAERETPVKVPLRELSDRSAADSISTMMKRVADWQIDSIRRNGWRHPQRDWTNGALYAGLLATAEATDNEAYYTFMKEEVGDRFDWKLEEGRRRFHADFYCVGQLYTRLYEKYGDRRMIADLQVLADTLLARPHTESLEWKNNIGLREWAWCDALFMGPPPLAMLARVTGNQAYLDLVDKLWWKTTDYLYDPDEHLYFRDGSFLGKREQNGAKIFWSRGNGWVMGGLVRVLENMPADYPTRDRWISLYKDMASRVASLQQADGSWHASLLDPTSYPIKETSGTGFFAYALAWGINQGILDAKVYAPTVWKAWDALVTSVHPSGKLGYVQPIGAAPKAVSSDQTEVYGVGAFLLCGREMLKMVAAD